MLHCEQIFAVPESGLNEHRRRFRIRTEPRRSTTLAD
jgi:hypothetical protein